MTHSYVFHLTKSERYFAAMDEVREPQMHPKGTQAAGFSLRQREATGNGRSLPYQYDAPNPLGKLPGSVWSIEQDDWPLPTGELPTPGETPVTFELHRADARRLPLADATVDLIVTSPPYYALRSYQDECVTCGGTGSAPVAEATRTAPLLSGPSAKSTLQGSKANRSGTAAGNGDCPACAGSGGAHYAGQIGSEPTPAEFLRALWAVLDECWRVLKPSGSCFVNLGDKFATYDSRPGNEATHEWAQKAQGGKRYVANAPAAHGIRYKSRYLLPHRFALGAIDPDYRTHVEGRAGDWPQWVCRMDIVWAKPNGLPESVTDRVRASHEYWFHLVRSERYFAAVDEVREVYLAPFATRTLGNVDSSRGDHGTPEKRLDAVDAMNPLGKLPGSVWSVPSEPLRVPSHLPQHFAAFPSEFPRRLILGWCPPGGTVLDPFVGTGTVCAVAHLLGRHGIGVDLSADYLRLARWRCEQDWSLYTKATGGEPDSRNPDQLALFEVTA